jgi:hypothetical protein
MERYDSEQDRRRDNVVNALASLVDDAKSSAQEGNLVAGLFLDEK